MDLTRLRTGEKITAISGIALILIMFIFDWFGLRFGPFEATGNAWDAYSVTNWVLLITGLGAIGVGYLSATRQQLNLPVAGSAIVAALGALSVLLIFISILSPPDFGSSVDLSGTGISHTRKIGVYLGLIAAIVLTYGAYLAMQEEGTSASGRADRRERRPGGGGPGAPPPPTSSSGP
jgi:hypothetical protein